MKTLMNFGMLVVMAVAMTVVTGSASAQSRQRGDDHDQTNHQRDWRSRMDRSRREFGQGHRKDTHGFRNYGQFRRTQVGNRRWRSTRRNFLLQNGIRMTRRHRERH